MVKVNESKRWHMVKTAKMSELPLQPNGPSLWSIQPFVVFFGVACILAVAVVAIGLDMAYFYHQLSLNGVVVTGKITRQETRSGSRGGVNHYSFYTYQDHHGRSHSSSTTIHPVPTGSDIEITYLRDAPDRHVTMRMTADKVYQPIRVTLLFALGLLAITLGFGRLIVYLLAKSGNKDL